MTALIQRILVANRGEIASRVFRTARALGLQTVAVYSEADVDMPFVRDADLAIPLRGFTSAESYLDMEQILEAMRTSGADAVHPGYGFLSENPALAEAVVAAGATWIGPTPESIRAMALKVEAKRLAESAGVPLVPGAEIPDDAPDPRAIAEAVGYPLLVKASAGGGGKGMRVVRDADSLADALASARREAASSFGDPTVFLERYLESARHVEVQVFGDTHGSVVHLYERECSIQRRHQKVVEESPSPGVTDAVAQRMYAAAVSLAARIGYVGAGTVEFLVSGSGPDQEFFFLEMNTRLQVEHPVTEAITGLDLVDWQIRVARGERLPLEQGEIVRSGHAIEVRLYAEDPARGYLPNTGTLRAFRIGEGLRVDSSVSLGTAVTAFYDPMLAKVIAHAPDRTTAASTLARGLRGSLIHGLVTNRDSLVAVLESSAFRAGDTTTAFLDDHPDVLAPAVPEDVRDRHLVAVVSTSGEPMDAVPVGWRNVPAVDEVLKLNPLGTDHEVTLSYLHRRDGLAVGLDLGSEPHRQIDVQLIDGGDVTVAGVRTFCSVERYGDLVCVDDGLWSTQWREVPRFADLEAQAAAQGPSTPVPGTITAVEVSVGDSVCAGQTLVVLEAMKMEHRIVADVDAVIAEVLVVPGQSVDAHAVVAVLSPAEEV